jgi:adenylate cyclase
MPESRKVAAILAADVVGYSRLASADEDRTLARLRALRSDLIDPTIAVHNGRVVKRTGDGNLVEFRSVVDAVRCAIEVQNGMVERNAGLSPERRIEFRVGIHLGDVVEESDGDLMGAGVNIAARLEGIAKPGAICLSEDAYRQVKGRLDLPVKDLGAIQLKNIAEPIRAYELEVSAADQAKRVAPEVPTTRLALPAKPSIAVLPFQNISGDPEQEYFADGMVEEIITALSRFKNLFVIARNSSFTYKGRAVDVKQVGRELGVRYVLEGSVRKAANRVRITAQLIDAASGAHLWADRFDGSVENIFDLQDQVAERVMGSIAPKLEEAEIERAKSKPTESLDAYDYYLRGLSTIRLFSSEALRESLRQYQRAIELDPEFAAAYGMMAWCYFRRYSNALMADWAGESVEAIAMARRAVELGSDDAIALCMGGVTLAGIALELDAGDAYIDRALVLNPNLAIAWSNSSLVKIFLGEHALAIDRITHAMRLNPLDPLLYRVHGLLAYAHFFSGHDDEALSWAEKALLAQPSFVPSAGIAAACYTKASRIADARRIVARMLQASPEMRISNFPVLHALRRQEDVVRYGDELRKAGLPD